MIRYPAYLLLLPLGWSTAVAAQTATEPPMEIATGDPPMEMTSGTPTNATASVSPTTVADAAIRADERGMRGEATSRFDLSLGTSYAGGDFGSGQSSRMWTTALGARYAIGTFRLSASIPYVRIRGRGLIFSGIDSTPIIVAGGTPGPRLTNKGVGDVTVGGTYTFPASDGQPEIELSGRVKFPIADRSSQISTGKTDYSAGVQITKTIGAFGPFVSGTYRIFGDPARLPGDAAGINLRNGFAASAGTSISLGERSVALLSYHYARAASRLVKDGHELFAGASTRFPGSNLRMTGYATAGVSSGAAAASGGLSLSFDF